MENREHNGYMQMALDLAKKGMYSSMPNPRVGCVVVHNHQIVGQGWHSKTGEDHAEVIALSQAGQKAKGATAYITLEPCNHHGKTPPCTEALISAGIGTVVYAMDDPNPEVSAKSTGILKIAGVKVIQGILHQESKDLNIGFVKRMKSGLPYIRSKIASSIDGKTALLNGKSTWISSEKSRQDVQSWRARSCALLTSIETVLSDDPSLNVRIDGFDDLNQPIRVVLDSQLRMESHYKILRLPGQKIIYTLKSKHNDPKIQNMIETAEEYDGRVSLRYLFHDLAKREINEVMIECGGVLNGALLRLGFIDELIVYIAPCVLGDQARNMFNLPVLSEISDRYNFDSTQVDQIDHDVRIILRKSNHI